MAAYTIQAACHDDIPALIVLLDTLFTIEQDFTPNHAAQQQGLELMLQQADMAYIAIAKNDAGSVIGMASAQLVVSTAEGAFSAWIEDVVVDANYRQHGIGSALLANVLDWATSKGATRAQLLADLDNTPALDFYQRTGWKMTRLVAHKCGLVKHSNP
ncbi:GNAT family N-acetyltransferase [Sulfuriferula nivalis]|uniref:N-acetyltransferase n=1 Tax=Sulfuriferula nivalis TaxID=2675298 RepID=A0A809RJI4_9PROT|nr:GNAT family N-acetyltransferase [Sulfuriferula nivalis]BBP00984.1 N-acetyltransferase [Sulfuriferula nivalis]